jgi:hypothetical protein
VVLGLSAFFVSQKLRGAAFLIMQQAQRIFRVWKLALASLLTLAGCSSREQAGGEATSPGLAQAGAAGAEVSCAADPRVSAFSKHLAQTGQSGVEVELDSAEPAPPAIGDNTWSVTVLDAAGDPLVGAQLTPSARMPDHGHMSPTTPIASVTDAEGHATISGLNLFMAGVWRIDLEITEAGADAPTDSVGFAFCIEG